MLYSYNVCTSVAPRGSPVLSSHHVHVPMNIRTVAHTTEASEIAYDFFENISGI